MQIEFRWLKSYIRREHSIADMEWGISHYLVLQAKGVEGPWVTVPIINESDAAEGSEQGGKDAG